MIIIHKIIGAAMIVAPLIVLFWRAPTETKAELISGAFYVMMMVMIVLGFGLLASCTTSKPVEVPVPAACVQPKLPQEPHYPIKDLKTGDSPATVIKAYVATAAGQHDYIERVKYIYEGDK